MRIFAYSCSDDTIPETRKWVARIWTGGDDLPVIFFAATETEVVRKANRWWASELDKAQAKADRAKARTKPQAQAAAPPADLPPQAENGEEDLGF